MEALGAAIEKGDRPRELGRGRSGVVYRCCDRVGRDVARKVFGGDGGDGAANLVHWVCFGAPNPYVWSEDAIACAFHRRAILERLVPIWFHDRLSVATAYATDWNDEHLAHSLDTRFVAGRPAALHHPYSAPRDDEVLELRRDIMKPLQRRLAESGFDGLVWQAGFGNPVALNNFLRTESGWAWIDLESGVPALVPANPLTLFTFYLPKSFHHRRPLFDDVDVAKLRRYVAGHGEWLAKRLGAAALEDLRAHIERLETHQNAWRTMPRPMRSITFRLRRGEITPAQAEWFGRWWPLWYARETGRGLAHGARQAAGSVGRAVRRMLSYDLRLALHRAARFLVDRAYRTAVAHRYVQLRISAWRARRQLSEAESATLSDRLHHESVGSYLTDFWIQAIATKPAVKLVQFGFVAPLMATGGIGLVPGTFLIVMGGSLVRTAYTLGRCVHIGLKRQRPPWVALLVGTIPVLGNTAFLVQKAWSLTSAEGKLAAFLLYDIVTWIGQKIPIWGGPDGGLEHRLNHLPDLIVRDRTPAAEAAPPARVAAG